MSTLHNRGPPAALPGAWNYINPLTAENKATDQRVSPIRSERVSPIPPVAQGVHEVGCSHFFVFSLKLRTERAADDFSNRLTACNVREAAAADLDH